MCVCVLCVCVYVHIFRNQSCDLEVCLPDVRVCVYVCVMCVCGVHIYTYVNMSTYIPRDRLKWDMSRNYDVYDSWFLKQDWLS